MLTTINGVAPCKPLIPDSEELPLTRSHRPPFWFDPAKWSLDKIDKHHRLQKHSKKSVALKDSLKLMGSQRLLGQTLLDESVRKKHTQQLKKRLFRRLSPFLLTQEEKRISVNQLRVDETNIQEPLKLARLRSRLGFLTVIHAVTALDEEQALKQAKVLIRALKKAVRSQQGMVCLGAVEYEIVSIPKMARIVEFNQNPDRKKVPFIDEDGVISFDESSLDPSFHKKKLTVLRVLAGNQDDPSSYRPEGQFLIHFHGILIAEKSSDIDHLKAKFLKNSMWNKVPGQVRISDLSKTWNKKYKSIEDNINDIASYICKGGNCQHNGVSYLKYNLKKPDALQISYGDYLFWSDFKDVEGDDFSSYDSYNLSIHEIHKLASVIDLTMSLNKSRTGYLVSIGRMNKSCSSLK